MLTDPSKLLKTTQNESKLTILRSAIEKLGHLHICKHKTVKLKLKLTLTLTLTLTDTGGAVLTLMLGYIRLRNYKLKWKIQTLRLRKYRGVYS